MISVITMLRITPDGSYVWEVYASLDSLKLRFSREDVAGHSAHGETAESAIMSWDGEEDLLLLPDNQDRDGSWLLQRIEIT